VELTGAIGSYTLQPVVISSAVDDSAIGVRVVGSYHRAQRLAGDEPIVELGVVARPSRAAPKVKADVVYLAGRLPLQENLTIASCSTEPLKSHGGRCMDHIQ